jgi:hypothetical protein
VLLIGENSAEGDMLVLVSVVQELGVIVLHIRDPGIFRFNCVQEIPCTTVLDIVLLGQLELDLFWKIRYFGKFV